MLEAFFKGATDTGLAFGGLVGVVFVAGILGRILGGSVFFAINHPLPALICLASITGVIVHHRRRVREKRLSQETPSGFLHLEEDLIDREPGNPYLAAAVAEMNLLLQDTDDSTPLGGSRKTSKGWERDGAE